MKKVIFVCIENSNRSQMAEAFGHLNASADVQFFSAGSKPGKQVNPKAVKAMSELDYGMDEHHPKSVDLFKDTQFDAVISMGCGEDCPYLETGRREDWLIPDPKHLSEKEYTIIRDYIGIKVKQLIEELNENE